jgi:phage tail sheath protein FI
LAPGVYVEETSFRAKSIEGVGTSTTGFVGPTRKGPVGGTPEILTSFGDFERIYGGQDNLGLTPAVNYMAHAVFAYFDNGGSRLYVSRTFLPNSNVDTGVASSADFTNGGADATKQSMFVARFPGQAGNGQVEVVELDTPATVRSMNSAVAGTLLRSGGSAIAAGAQLQGGAPTFAVANDGIVILTINNVDAAPIHFHGESAEVAGTALAADPVTIDGTNDTLKVSIDGVAQTVSIPHGAIALADLINLINPLLVGGYARAAKKGITIGSDVKGKSSTVTVFTNAGLGFAADTTVTGAATPANTVGNLNKVTADEINALLVAGGIGARAGLSASTGKLTITTTATGAAATLSVKADPASVAAALGLPVGQTAKGVDGKTAVYYVKHGNSWVDSGGNTLNLGGLNPGDTPGGVPADFITVSAITTDADGNTATYAGMGLDSGHPSYIGTILAMKQKRRVDDLQVAFGVTIGSNITAFDLRAALFASGGDRVITLSGGNDGGQPIAQTYVNALLSFEQLEDISIVAAPGHSAFTDFAGIQQAVISHAERRRAYRIAVLDTPPQQAVSDARTTRAAIDSTYAALYYPWIVISNPLWRPGLDQVPRELTVPPSGHMCGIYARSDDQRGVWKAPANEVVRGALRFESDINFGQQEVLNPLGVNCLRYFPGRGYRVWGARTASSDPEWKYVNVRRYFIYLEASLDGGTQWAVFEPNGEALWANIRETVTSFLYNEFVSGALLGATPQEAFFVKCDRSTMTQGDLDNGRLICLVGVAALKPAEFVIFRIGQKTADAKN